MQTTDSDWGRIYPNMITWITGGKVVKEGEDPKDAKSAPNTYHLLTWVRFWREGKEYQLPVRMEAEGVETLEDGAKMYDERFHKRCLDIIRFGRTTGDFKEPIKFHDDHVVIISYEDFRDLDKVEDEKVEEEEK